MIVGTGLQTRERRPPMDPKNPSYHPPQVHHVHVPNEPPPGVPSPFVPIPIHPDVLKYQEDKWRERNWTAGERPVLAIISGFVTLVVVSYCVFKAVSALGPFEPSHWLGNIIAGFFFCLTVGAIIACLVLAAVMLVVNALCWLFTGKGIDMTPGPRYGPMDDPFEAIMFGAGFFGIFIGEIVWVIAGIAAVSGSALPPAP